MVMATNVALKMEAVFRPLSPHQTACAVCVTVATTVTATTVLRLRLWLSPDRGTRVRHMQRADHSVLILVYTSRTHSGSSNQHSAVNRSSG